MVMGKSYSISLMLTLILSGTYMYTMVEAVCKVPIEYRLGFMDNRFDLTEDEARLAISEAESLWEEATGRNLFTYDSEADFTVNFIFDERQQKAEAEVDFRERLDVVESVNSVIGETYAELVERYEVLDKEYKAKVAAYENRLAAYNTKVESYNATGGAPEKEFEALQAERTILDQEVDTVNSLGRQLNGLTKEINRVSEKGNQLIEQYNENVDTYNNKFGESHEFTQGDYKRDNINVYKFINEMELKLVLAHELGHALSLDHVEGETSILYQLLGGQPSKLKLTEEDIYEFERVCGRTTQSFIERLFIRFGL